MLMGSIGARGGKSQKPGPRARAIEKTMEGFGIMKQQKRRGGRPRRAVASAKALAGVDLSTLDPLAVLRGIAGDTSAPATARVAACRALLLADPKSAPEGDDDPITRLALKLLAKR